MPQATRVALMGLGLNHELASVAGADPITQAGVGTAQTGATLLQSKSVELTTTGGNTAFVLNSGLGINEPVFVFNSAATAAKVFVPSGHTLNGTLNGNVNSGTGITQNKAAYLWQYKRTFWASVLTA